VKFCTKKEGCTVVCQKLFFFVGVKMMRKLGHFSVANSMIFGEKYLPKIFLKFKLKKIIEFFLYMVQLDITKKYKQLIFSFNNLSIAKSG
jgi:hypothetical protein